MSKIEEPKRLFVALFADTARNLVDLIQKEEVKHKDIVTILPDKREGYVVFYYKDSYI